MELWEYAADQGLLKEIEDYIDKQIVNGERAIKFLATKRFIFYHIIAKPVEKYFREEISLCLDYFNERVIASSGGDTARRFVCELEEILGYKLKVERIRRNNIRIGPIKDIKP